MADNITEQVRSQEKEAKLALQLNVKQSLSQIFDERHSRNVTTHQYLFPTGFRIFATNSGDFARFTRNL